MNLILGGSGYVGQAFVAYFEQHGIPYLNVSRKDLDYYNKAKLLDLITDTKATFLVNTAGYTGKPNVDACELHKSDCLLGNAVLPGVIKEACEMAQIPWGHVSSGCIYTGRREDGQGFTEEDVPNFSFRTDNCSFYSGTKALGEEVLKNAASCYVWRLRIPFDHVDSPRNYLSKMMNYERLLEAENSISHLDEFVSACWQCWAKRIPYGIYNVTNTGFVTTRMVVDKIVEILKPGKEYQFFASEDEFMQTAAKTPRSNCILDNSKLLKAGVEISDVEKAIDMSLRNWKAS